MKYITVIGLEIHCAIKTKAKVFSDALNSYDINPNVNVSPIDLGFPGVLPILNKNAVRQSLKTALCLNCKISEILIFDRKNYYYPDLPKGFQITQAHSPIGVDGYIDINVNNEAKKVFIHDIHLEEDTASLDHFDSYSLINYNRAGSPLIEIVTTPCLNCAEEVLVFLRTLKNILKYADISDADITKGELRCDVNISLKKEEDLELGTKVEIKNINSFENILKAIEVEVKRQENLLNEGKQNEIIQETRRYDEKTNTTIRMREKVEGIDYKYFIEPNIPPIKLTKEEVETIKKDIPELPYHRFYRYTSNYGLTETEANIILKSKEIADYFETCLSLKIDTKTSFNWITSNILSILNQDNLSIRDFFVTPERLKVIIDAINEGVISNSQGKDILKKASAEKIEPTSLIETQKKDQISEEELKKIISQVLLNNQENITKYKSGVTNLFDYFVGQVMKETKGKANPVSIKEMLAKELL